MMRLTMQKTKNLKQPPIQQCTYAKASSKVHSSQPFYDGTVTFPVLSVSFLGWCHSATVNPVPLCNQCGMSTHKFLLLQKKSSFAQLGNADILVRHKHIAHLHTQNFVRIPTYEVRIGSKCISQKIY